MVRELLGAGSLHGNAQTAPAAGPRKGFGPAGSLYLTRRYPAEGRLSDSRSKRAAQPRANGREPGRRAGAGVVWLGARRSALALHLRDVTSPVTRARHTGIDSGCAQRTGRGHGLSDLEIRPPGNVESLR